MQSFEFTINEVSVGPGEHSWVAIEDETQTKIPLPKGGNTIGEKSYVGQYPEIQEFLKEKYGVEISLAYDSQIDEFSRDDEDGNYQWVFRRQAAQVVVNDIPRTKWRIGVGS